MNKFLVVLVNTPTGSESIRLNELIQTLAHPAVDRVFECVQGSQFQCPYPIENVGTIPVIKYMLKRGKDQYQEVAESIGVITKDSVLKKLDALSKESFPDLDGNGGDGIIPSDTNPGGPMFNPFGLFDLPINPPGWLWLAIAGIALYKASSSKNPVGMYGWGAAGLVAGLNYLNKRKSN